jgi:hypothetical protein
LTVQTDARVMVSKSTLNHAELRTLAHIKWGRGFGPFGTGEFEALTRALIAQGMVASGRYRPVVTDRGEQECKGIWLNMMMREAADWTPFESEYARRGEPAPADMVLERAH